MLESPIGVSSGGLNSSSIFEFNSSEFRTLAVKPLQVVPRVTIPYATRQNEQTYSVEPKLSNLVQTMIPVQSKIEQVIQDLSLPELKNQFILKPHPNIVHIGYDQYTLD